MGENNNIKEIIAAYEALYNNKYTAILDEKSYIQLIEHYSARDQWEMVLSVAQTGIEQFLYSIEFYLAKAEALIALRKFSEAEEVLSKAKNLAPSETEIQMLEAQILMEQHRLQDASVLIEELKQKDLFQHQSELLLLEAQLYQRQEQYEGMFYLLSYALREDPNHQDLLDRFGICIEITKRYKESVVIHQEILDRDPYAYMAWYNLGNAQAYLGNYPEAIDAYEFAFAIQEDFKIAIKSCADLCFELQLFHKSKKYYHELLDLQHSDADTFLRLGQNYLYLEDYATARTFLTKAIQFDFQNDEAYYNIGQTYFAEENWKAAIKYFEKAIYIEDSQEDYFLSLALALGELDQIEEAEEQFLTALEIAPEHNGIWIEYALFLLHQSRGEDAGELLEGALEFAEDSSLLYCRVACFFAMGNRQAGFYWLSDALEEDFENYPLLFHYLPELQNDGTILGLISSYLP
ncbi:MAG: tetratricopeptide repeat protein [Saprospiraceae bacterium]|jgi:tetratricopeptide (TPR) repeat protein|nr:tetratricopeptide repeat protein [Saprospiraceae bacterium]